MYKPKKNNQTFAFPLGKVYIKAKTFVQKKCFYTSSLCDKSKGSGFNHKKCSPHNVKTPTPTNLKSFSSKGVLEKNVIVKTTNLPKSYRDNNILNDATNLEKKQLQIVRSKCFGGQLNKGWVNKDLYRYELNFSQLHKLGGAENTFFDHAATTKPKVQTVLTNGSTTPPEKSKGSKAALRQEPRKNKILPFGCLCLDKIILHSNSGKLLQAPSSSAIMDLAFSTISCQTPMQIYSRKSIAGFKLTKSALLGVKTTLRGLAKLEFYYKWYFLGASVPKIAHMHFSSKSALQKENLSLCPPYSKKSTAAKKNTFAYKTSGFNKYSGAIPYEVSALSSSLAIQNVFVFTELDRLDYDYFSTLSGFEIFFVKKNFRS